MTKEFNKGDEVRWNTPQGRTEGKIVEKITKDTEFLGKTYKATPEAPKYKVKSNQSGKYAFHDPKALKGK